MAKRAKPQPRCIIIAGPNGAGKTTFSRMILTDRQGILHFVNADLIAASSRTRCSSGGTIITVRTGSPCDGKNLLRA
ncbi:MAG: hypothetical protein R2817_11990 [Flavobacteriales bacterium]